MQKANKAAKAKWR